MNREAIYAGLFNKVAAIGGFVTTSRLLKHWAEVSPDLQPALYQAQASESAETITGCPTKWMLHVKLYLYVRTDGLTPPSTIMNPLLDAIDAAMQYRNPITGKNDLGGLPGVEWARIDGEIQTDEGTLGQQAVAVVPILILVTD
jgi:hypothetical protein